MYLTTDRASKSKDPADSAGASYLPAPDVGLLGAVVVPFSACTHWTAVFR